MLTHTLMVTCIPSSVTPAATHGAYIHLFITVLKYTYSIAFYYGILT